MHEGRHHGSLHRAHVANPLQQCTDDHARGERITETGGAHRHIARVWVADHGIGENDDQRDPKAKEVLKEALAAAKVNGEVELYPKALHGWCMSDMPVQAGQPAIYNKDDAERAWAKLLALYKAALS